MLRVSAIYPSGVGTRFDWDYYLKKHMAMVDRLLRPYGLVRSEVDRGVGSGQPDAAAPYVAIAHMYFNSAEDFQKALAIHGKTLMADVPNYTDIQPQMQVSEIVR